LREPARRQGRELTPQLAALDQADFERLSATEAALVRSYYGLDGNPPFTKKELAGRFELSVGQVDAGLKRAVAVLLTPESDGALGPEAHRQQRRERIAQRRRERGRPLASAMHDLATDAFEKLGALEGELAQRYYGIGGERRWTRRELAREFGLSTDRVDDLVNAAVRILTGTEVAPRFDRTCAVCGGSFTLRSRVRRRRTSGSGCEGELKRWAGRASASARVARSEP
jgi:DNA-directed RNA polymerase sigma subunit (sigma70/sigma32)